MTWAPISLESIYDHMNQTRAELRGPHQALFDIIRIEPCKWALHPWGDHGGGFWVVALFGTSVLWYNDIECGYNISTYSEFGRIVEYWCNQDDLATAVRKAYGMLQFNGTLTGQTGPPSPSKEAT